MTVAPSYPASRAAPRARPFDRGVAAVLGPTNTGKTHHAIERMLSFPSGVIGLPLRLLAREVYNRVAERVGARGLIFSSPVMSATLSAPTRSATRL